MKNYKQITISYFLTPDCSFDLQILAPIDASEDTIKKIVDKFPQSFPELNFPEKIYRVEEVSYDEIPQGFSLL